MINTIFVNKGSDEALVKSFDKSGKVQKEISYKTKTGKTATRKQWVNVDDVKQTNVKKQVNKPDDNKVSKPAVKVQYFPMSDCGKSETKAYTQTDIDKQLAIHYNKNKGKYNMSFYDFKRSPQASSWVKANYFISDGESQTQDAYRDRRTGEYTPERKKLHAQIIKKIVDSANKPPEGEKPVAILMGGGSASGKGTIRKAVVVPTLDENGIKVGISDSDDIKNELPEYKKFQDQLMETAAYRVHEESSYLADKAVDAMIKEGKNLMFDGTMKNYQKYINLIDKLHKAGYEVQIVGADVPLDVAIERSDKRAIDTGRKVPHSIITGSHGGFAQTLPLLVDKADSTVLYDNSGSSPKLIMSDGEVKDTDLYNNFLQKGETHRVNKKIRQLSKDYDVQESVLKDYLDNGATIDELEEFLDTMGTEGLEDL